MPLREGFTIARSLRRKDDQTPVLFLAANDESKKDRRGFEQKETKVWVSILSGASTAASATLELLASRFL
jgi:CheY-like chemotaxis protein